MTISQRINNGLRRVPSWPLYLLLIFPGGFMFYLGATGDELGPDPIKELLHIYGEFGLQMMIVTLLIRPIHRWTGVRLIKFRRATGLLSFYYIVAHLFVFVALDYGWQVDRIVEEVIKRPFITFGMLGFLVMVPLAVTSNNFAVRKIGPAGWSKIHRLVYLAAAAGAVHYLLIVKGWPAEPFVYVSVITVLLLVRLWWTVSKRKKAGA